MCGIAGVLAEMHARSDVDLVEHIVARQYRRGPDHQAVEEVAGPRFHVSLGHNRLSILDLSAAGHQPMWDAGGEVCLVHNGEVYNHPELRSELEARGHRFRTRTDTETIVEAFKRWGTEAFARFDGMFACALLDARRGRLYLVRDRFGVKPLYLAVHGNRLVFASTAEVIARDLGLPANLDYLARGVRYGVYEDGELAPFDGMKALAPGHYLEAWLDDGRLVMRVQPYYRLPDRVAALADSLAGLPESKLVQMVTEAIEDAVAVRLRADVPVGVVLSSGLDSSAVSTLAAQRQGRGVKAFTFGHPRDRRSEARLVQRLADALGVDTRFTDPETRGIIEAFFDTLEAQGAPFTSGSVVGQYCVYREAHAAGVKVLLGGQGGDEAFMGYRKFYLFWLEHLVAKRRYAEALACAGGLVRMALAEVPRASSYWAASVRYRRRGWSGGVLALPPCDPLPLRPVAASPLRLRQMEDVTRWSLPTLLRYEDRNSMANSVESRLPFMDHRVVELGLALPESMKVRHGYGKWIVREAMRGRVPERIRAARWKRGFDVGQERWIRRGLGRAIRGAILARRRAAAEWLAPGVRVEEAFSDRALIRRGGGFAEATTLIWLGGLQRDTGSPERRGPHAEVSA